MPYGNIKKNVIKLTKDVWPANAFSLFKLATIIVRTSKKLHSKYINAPIGIVTFKYLNSY